MNGNELLVDTNILIYYFDGNNEIKEFIRNKILYISIINEMEILSFPSLSNIEIDNIIQFISQIEVEPINEQIKNLAIRIRREDRLKLADSIIAATALYLDVPIFTIDSDFEKVDSLNIIRIEI